MSSAPKLYLITAISTAFVCGWTASRLAGPAEPPGSPLLDEITAPSRATSERGGSRESVRLRMTPPDAPGYDRLLPNVSLTELAVLAKQAAASDDPIENESLLRVLVARWAERDLVGALHFASGLSRDDLLQIAMLTGGTNDAPLALAWLEQNVSLAGQRNHLSMSVYRGLARQDPHSAIELLKSRKDGFADDGALDVIVDEWASQDIPAVFDWIEQQGLTPQTANIYRAVMAKYIDAHPQDAAALIGGMEDSPLKGELAAQAATRQARSDVGAALQWTLTLDPSARSAALSAVVEVWANSSGAPQALEYAVSNQQQSPHHDLLQSTATAIAYTKPEILINRLETLDGGDQLVVAKRLAIALSTTDPARCDQWLQSLPAGPLRDVAVESAFDLYRNQRHSEAFSLSETLLDETKRLSLMTQAVEGWSEIDPASAQQALMTTASLTPGQKRHILDSLAASTRTPQYLLPPAD